jgi:hypothetical protein
VVPLAPPVDEVVEPLVDPPLVEPNVLGVELLLLLKPP